MVKKLDLPTSPAEQKARTVKRLDLPTESATTVPAEDKRVKTLSLSTSPHQRTQPERVKKRTIVDDLLDKVAKIDPTITALDIRAKIEEVMSLDVSKMLDWGNRNLAPLQKASNIQTDLSSRMSMIDAAGWLKMTMEASCKKPSLLDVFSNQKSPEYYESMLTNIRAKLLQLVTYLNQLQDEYSPDVRDLQLDAIAITVILDIIQNDDIMLIASNRARSLTAAHQTGKMLLESIKQTKLQCATFIQQIDDMISVTLPAWKLAYKNK